jgi:LmbE family N-acetylglucosaminyl deacetylase
VKAIGRLLDGFEALPEANIATVLAGRAALILAPHPDDETLGCGGLIAAACAASLPPAVAIMTDGAASHPDSKTFPPARLRGIREAETKRALEILGLGERRILFMRYPDAALTVSADAIARACAFGRAQNCGVIIGPWAADPHCDHQATAAIATAVARATGWPLLSYPVWGWLRDRRDNFDEPRSGGYRLNITPHLAAKQRAIAAHASQYGGLIADSPKGFQLPKNLLNIFARNFEVYIG